MTTNRRIACVMLAGALFATDPGSAAEEVTQAKTKKVRPLRGGPARQVQPVKVTIDAGACRHHMTPPGVRLDVTNNDAVGWRIRNNCASAQKVLLCVYKKGGELLNPFKPCVSTPTAGLDVGTTFVVASGGREDLDCDALREGTYEKLVLVGGEVPADGCPAQRPPHLGPRTHRLDVEIVR